jgi:hypothetical protein
MLRIARSEVSDRTHMITLQGKLLGPWISELESACGMAQVPADRVRLELGDLTFVDAAGARFLEALIRDGARVIACSMFVAEILQLEQR